MIIDPIGDLLTRIRNGQMRRTAKVRAPHSRLRIRLLDVPAGCVQYHPEAGPGPNDSLGLFDEFLGAFSAA